MSRKTAKLKSVPIASLDEDEEGEDEIREPAPEAENMADYLSFKAVCEVREVNRSRPCKSNSIDLINYAFKGRSAGPALRKKGGRLGSGDEAGGGSSDSRIQVDRLKLCLDRMLEAKQRGDEKRAQLKEASQQQGSLRGNVAVLSAENSPGGLQENSPPASSKQPRSFIPFPFQSPIRLRGSESASGLGLCTPTRDAQAQALPPNTVPPSPLQLPNILSPTPTKPARAAWASPGSVLMDSLFKGK